MALTKHQEYIYNEAIHILKSENRLLIKGSAGVGKTYLIDQLIKYYEGNKIVVAAPTHKALEVIRGKLTGSSNNVELATTHAILKLVRKRDHKGNVNFIPRFSPDNPPLKKVKYLFIDEISMTPTYILNLIEEFATQFNVKVIFIGDDKQLNPVGELTSPAFDKNYPTLELTEIIRQGAGNPIIDLSRNIKMIKSKKEKLLYLVSEPCNHTTTEATKKGYIFSNNINKVISSLAKINGTNDLKYLAWTNKEVNLINKLVREKIYTNPRKIELGETLIFDNSYANGEYHTNAEIKVKTIKLLELNYPHKFSSVVNLNNNKPVDNIEYFKITVYCINENDLIREGEEVENGIFIIHENSEKIYNVIKKDIELRCKLRESEWKDLDTFENKFAQVKYNHAITIHKS